MTFRVFRWCACLALASLAAHAHAYDPPTPAQVAAAQKQFAEDLARDTDLSAADVLATLAKARYQQSIIDAISRPAESKTWREYRPIFLTSARIDGGVSFYRANQALFDRVEKEFGVPATILVAIIGVETNYGRTPTRYRVLDALTTLGFYYPPRADFFRGELRQLFLLHGASFPYPIESLMGSYAGAMGMGQFMPSSIAKFARDEDGDGRIDLWNSLPDIVASIANYFVGNGWKSGGPVAVRAKVGADARAVTPENLKPVYPLRQLAEWGYAPATRLDVGDDTLATLVRLEGEDGPEVWITLQNFYAISRYNRSPLYSLAVYQLSAEIAAQVGGQSTPK
ncbi:MAG: lytic murein transglycosylase B [Rudaea sp.]|uniref:lytic murein transglycosylase B n=1 Tax=Rudaea sp. TaxID=2136325 RepID=UPI0039E3578D